MAFEAKILADSFNTATNDRLVTFELTYPRFIHSELMTHRMFSRNAASSRAIPVEKLIERVMTDPVIPIHWGANQKGMQAKSELSAPRREYCEQTWLVARNQAVSQVRLLLDQGLHKQIANRLLEPWMWITVIVSATSFEHFRRLRVHPDAEPHFQKIAGMAADLYDSHEPTPVEPGGWHLPLTGFDGDENLYIDELVKLSVARCARVSYLTHDGQRDVEADYKLYERIRQPGHWSPFEHAAQAIEKPKWIGNFRGWKQARKFFTSEFIDEPRQPATAKAI